MIPGGSACVSIQLLPSPFSSLRRSCSRVICTRPSRGRRGRRASAAVPSEKGGQDVFGAYDVAPWPKPLSSCRATRRGRGAPVSTSSPRVRTAYSSCSVASCPSSSGRSSRFGCRRSDRASSSRCSACRCATRRARALPERSSVRTARRPATIWMLASRASTTAGSTSSPSGTRQGNLIEDWTQWDKMFRRPHAVYISPYDPQKNVWIVDDYRHAIFKFSNDGKKLLQTIGEPNVPGNDDKHFYRPTFMAWLPDGTFFVADGYQNTRVVKFDKDGKYLMTWGQRGDVAQGEAPRLLQQRARRRGRSADAARVRQRSQQRPRAGVRREREVSSTSGASDRGRCRTSTCSSSRAIGSCGPPIAARRSS